MTKIYEDFSLELKKRCVGKFKEKFEVKKWRKEKKIKNIFLKFKCLPYQKVPSCQNEAIKKYKITNSSQILNQKHSK